MTGSDPEKWCICPEDWRLCDAKVMELAGLLNSRQNFENSLAAILPRRAKVEVPRDEVRLPSVRISVMVNAWPTIDVLKTLKKKGKLSSKAREFYDCALSATEENVKVNYLAKCMLQTSRDSVLIQDFCNKFENGKADTQREMTGIANQPVYECREKVRPAWRGAVIFPKDCQDAWLIYVDTHEHFHKGGPRSLKDQCAAGRMGPKDLDKYIRDICVEDIERKEQTRQLFEAFIDALRLAVNEETEAPITLPEGEIFEGGGVTLDISPQVIDELDRDLESAHEDVLVVTLKIAQKTQYEAKQFLTKVGMRLIQPAEGEYNSIWNGDLVIEFFVTRARLLQLLALAKSDVPTENLKPPEPTVLHWAMKKRLVEAYVEGTAVQAVCGVWWVPVGDEKTHNNLPVCPDCAAEEPVAQALESLRHTDL